MKYALLFFVPYGCNLKTARVNHNPVRWWLSVP